MREGYGDMLLAECGGQQGLFQRLFKPHRDLFERPPVGPPLGATATCRCPLSSIRRWKANKNYPGAVV